jgi:hypothetical protein
LAAVLIGCCADRLRDRLRDRLLIGWDAIGCCADVIGWLSDGWRL